MNITKNNIIRINFILLFFSFLFLIYLQINKDFKIKIYFKYPLSEFNPYFDHLFKNKNYNYFKFIDLISNTMESKKIISEIFYDEKLDYINYSKFYPQTVKIGDMSRPLIKIEFNQFKSTEDAMYFYDQYLIVVSRNIKETIIRFHEYELMNYNLQKEEIVLKNLLINKIFIQNLDIKKVFTDSINYKIINNNKDKFYYLVYIIIIINLILFSNISLNYFLNNEKYNYKK